MTISYNDLQSKIINLSALLFTMPDSKSNSATEIWIKFRGDGQYIFISFSRPIPFEFDLRKLVGSGNALDVSENKRATLLDYNDTLEVKEVLNNSIHYKNNVEDTVLSIIALFDSFQDRFLHLSR